MSTVATAGKVGLHRSAGTGVVPSLRPKYYQSEAGQGPGRTRVGPLKTEPTKGTHCNEPACSVWIVARSRAGLHPYRRSYYNRTLERESISDIADPYGESAFDQELPSGTAHIGRSALESVIRHEPL